MNSKHFFFPDKIKKATNKATLEALDAISAEAMKKFATLVFKQYSEPFKQADGVGNAGELQNETAFANWLFTNNPFLCGFNAFLLGRKSNKNNKGIFSLMDDFLKQPKVDISPFLKSSLEDIIKEARNDALEQYYEDKEEDKKSHGLYSYYIRKKKNSAKVTEKKRPSRSDEDESFLSEEVATKKVQTTDIRVPSPSVIDTGNREEEIEPAPFFDEIDKSMLPNKKRPSFSSYDELLNLGPDVKRPNPPPAYVESDTAKISRLEMENKNLQKKIRAMEGNKEPWKDMLSSARTTIENQKRQIDDLEEKLVSVTREMDDFRSLLIIAYDEKREWSQKGVKREREKIAALKEDNSRLEEEVSRLEGEVSQYQKRFYGVRDQLDSAHKEVDALKQEKTNLAQQNNTLQQALNLRNALANLSARAAAYPQTTWTPGLFSNANPVQKDSRPSGSSIQKKRYP